MAGGAWPPGTALLCLRLLLYLGCLCCEYYALFSVFHSGRCWHTDDGVRVVLLSAQAALMCESSSLLYAWMDSVVARTAITSSLFVQLRVCAHI
jgi:hypothetical protein